MPEPQVVQMADFDGSVKINTKIDLSGIDKDLKNASAKFIKLNNDVKQTHDALARVQSRMKTLGGETVPTKEYEQITVKVQRAEQALQLLVNKKAQLEESGAGSWSKEITTLNEQIAKADSNLKALMDVQKQIAADGGFVSGKDTQEYANLSIQEEKLNGNLSVRVAKLNEEKAKALEAAAAERERQQAAGDVSPTTVNKTPKGNASSSISEKVNNVGKQSKKGFLSMFSGSKKASSGVKQLSKNIKAMTTRLMNVFKSVFIFTVLTKALTAVRERMGTLISTNSQLSGSLAQIKGNLNTAFQSIFSAVLPALNALFSALVKVTSVIAAFVSGIFGKSVKASQAAAKAADAQASSIGGVGSAAKKASKQLMSFDDAQILKSDEDSSGGASDVGGGGITPEYGDIDTSVADKWVKQIKDAWANADFTDIGISIGQKINTALASIPWDGIRDTLNKIASSIATFFNGVLAGTDWSLVGGTIAEALNTAVGFVYTHVTTFNWASLGTAIANTINGFVQKTDFKLIAKTISASINGLLSTIVSFIATTDWAEIGRSIVRLIVNIDWAQILVQLGDGLIGLVVGAFELLFGIVGELSSSVGDFFNAIGSNSIGGLFKGIADTLATAANWIKEKFNQYIVQPVKDFFGIHSPSTLFAELGNFITEGLKNGIVEKIKAIPGIFKNIFTEAWKLVTGVFSNVGSFFGGIVTKIKNLFQNVGGEIASAVSKTFASGVNGVFSTIENIVNGFINAINSCIRLINKIPGVEISKLSTISLPRLASGDVVPANYGEFLAVLGDNKRATEVVSPLPTMKQAFKEAIQEMGGVGGNGTINLTINLDGQVIYKSVIKHNNRNTKITGENALAT